MHDIALIRGDPAAFDRALGRRGLAAVAAELLALDERRRATQTELQALQQRRNEASREIGRLKGQGPEAAGLTAEVGRIKERMPALEADDAAASAALADRLARLPNLAQADVPDGLDETGNVELRRIGTPPAFAFAARQHFEIGEALGLMDFEIAAKLAGARFVMLRGALAQLERALAAFMIDIHTREFGYQEVAPPLLVRSEVPFGTGNLPKAGEEMFRTVDDRWLIPTAEVPLTNVAADRILEAAELPIRMTAATPCFRSEAGAAGRDTRGMLRQHQFTKVELVSITAPEASHAEHERMTEAAETVLRRLELPFRTVVLCTGDMGFASSKTYDIEVWLPGQDAYREISSCSNCLDFQARRMKARYRPAGEKATRFVHTLNGSGVAVGRALIAIVENGQQADGSVALPAALVPYMGGLDRIAAA
jgi:seryl-tRNA synthetase